MLVDGKRLLITGVLTPGSIAYAVARQALDNGAEVVLTGFGRGRSLTERTARRLPKRVDVLELDATRPEDVSAVREELERRWGHLDGILHAIAFAPSDALGGKFLSTPFESAATAFHVSAFSLKTLTAGLLPVLEGHDASVVTLDFDARVAWPVYDWMGVCKAALESVTRYLARDLGPRGIRVNAVSAGPLRTMAARSIPGFDLFADVWARRAPLGWDVSDATDVARSVLWLLSDWSRRISGELIHVDGGFHAMGSDLLSPEEQEQVVAAEGEG
ncbi:MAG TPA: enoyl-ACP reductase FabI [Actinomycetes bacterium]|nr:enoyl-ACP reductase FabI [Actinomycetes bacterium]